MTEAVELAAADSAAKVLSSVGLVVAIGGDWPLGDPAREVAMGIGLTDVRTAVTPFGGNMPQHAVSEVASRIVVGDLDAGIVLGGEHGYSLRICGERPWQRRALGPPPDEELGERVRWWTELERARGLSRPLEMYALVESAIQAELGRSTGEHRAAIADLWRGFNEVAAANPMAWSRELLGTDELRDGSTTNPMVMFPYTRAMVANPFVDQAAAVVVCAAERAAAAGIPEDAWVFLHSSATANDTLDLAARFELGRSPAMALAGRHTLSSAGVGIDDVDHLDLYSCFPCAVEVAMDALGLASDRQLTVTGGLTFFGGPHNNYVTHAIAEMYCTLRDDPGSLGLVTANGGYLTKHAFGLYSTVPPKQPFRFDDLTDHVALLPTRPVTDGALDDVTVEAHTVSFGRESTRTWFSCLAGDGARTWAWSDEAGLCAAACEQHLGGQRGRVSEAGEFQA